MSYSHKSKDGLLSSNDPKAVALWDQLEVEQKDRQASWSKALREMGVKLEHPDDGWVTGRGTETQYLTLSWYVTFDDGVEIGDLIALGRPSISGKLVMNDDRTAARDGYRICRVTNIDNKSGILGGITTKLYYEDTGIRYPSENPQKKKKKLFGRKK